MAVARGGVGDERIAGEHLARAVHENRRCRLSCLLRGTSAVAPAGHGDVHPAFVIGRGEIVRLEFRVNFLREIDALPAVRHFEFLDTVEVFKIDRLRQLKFHVGGDIDFHRDRFACRRVAVISEFQHEPVIGSGHKQAFAGEGDRVEPFVASGDRGVHRLAVEGELDAVRLERRGAVSDRGGEGDRGISVLVAVLR